jgi:hypothetical protein
MNVVNEKPAQPLDTDHRVGPTGPEGDVSDPRLAASEPGHDPRAHRSSSSRWSPWLGPRQRETNPAR